MTLELKNIGMIKEANVKIDGLTVIAGENDTGKSTLGKALFVILQSLIPIKSAPEKIKDRGLLLVFVKNFYKKIFEEEFSMNTEIKLILSKNIYTSLNFTNQDFRNLKSDNIPNTILFVETPLVWNFMDTFKNIALIGQQTGIGVSIPYLMNDLAIKLTNSSTQNSKIDISNMAENIMQGNFKKDNSGTFFFEKDETKIKLINTATGIKYFGILQTLSHNGWLSKNNVLILDEPEVHLHPKWQLEMAKIIVELVKNGVKIVVNSHSPYMIDALKYYADKFKVNNDFYLAEKNEDETSIIRNVTFDISPIFEKLTEPLERLHKMKLGLVDDN